MIKKLQNKKFRQAFVASNVRRGIAYQLRAMRGKMTQAKVGKMVGKPQNVISRLEDPRYGKVRLQTLLEVAAAFDVALLVKFVSYGRLSAETQNLSQEMLVPLSYDAEMKLINAAPLRSDYKQAPAVMSVKSTPTAKPTNHSISMERVKVIRQDTEVSRG